MVVARRPQAWDTGGRTTILIKVGVQALDALQRELGSNRPSLILVYGRRRVGKSTLLLKALESSRHIYYVAARLTDSINRHHFRDRIQDYVAGDDPVLRGLDDWDGLLAYVLKILPPDGRPLTVVLDEFPYLAESNPGLPSIIQRVWDALKLRAMPLKLVLCGSSVAFMEELLGEKSPLYGRQTLKLKLEPLPFRDAAQFFPNWSADDKLRAYAVFGGIPYHLSHCDPEESLASNIQSAILRDGAPLREEPEHLLQGELRNISRYASILDAIASGCTQVGEILGRVGEAKYAGELAPYLSRLEALQLIRRSASLDRRDAKRDRHSRYFLDDPFLAFWYRFVLPNRSVLAAGFAQEVYARVIAPRLDQYVGGIFERICRDFMRLHGPEIFGEPVREVGKIWASDFDIDVAGSTIGGVAFYGECKWWSGPTGRNVLDDLQRKAARTPFGADAVHRHFLVFSQGGFTSELTAIGSADGRIHLVDPDRLLGASA